MSKDIDRFSPYAGVAVRVWMLDLGAEVDVARVTGYGFKVAFGA